MNREAGGNELGLARAENQRGVDTRAQIEPGRTRRGVRRQRELAANAGVENADFQGAIAMDRRNLRVHQDTLARRSPVARSANRSVISATRSRANATFGACGSS